MKKTCQNCMEAEATERENSLDLCKTCVENIARAMENLAEELRISQSMFGTISGCYDRDEYWDRKR